MKRPGPRTGQRIWTPKISSPDCVPGTAGYSRGTSRSVGTDFPEANAYLDQRIDETEAWIDFLEGKGTLHIIADLGESPKRFVDLEERIPISTSTLNDRLKEGIRLDAWEQTRVVVEDGDRKVYRLTSSGRNVYRGLEDNGGVEASREARRHLSMLERVQQELIERLREDDSRSGI